MLDVSTFKLVVEHTPLVSIDLIVKNASNEILLGKRLNRPAKGYWFVPGGRILKNETIDDAFARLVEQELAISYSITAAKFIGNYEHMYTDNFSNECFSTHYIVLGYEVKIDINLANLPKEQHQNYQWMTVSKLMDSPKVHQNTKNYFISA